MRGKFVKFLPHAENRSRLHWPDRWSAQRGTWQVNGEASGGDKWSAERSTYRKTEGPGNEY